MSDHPAVTTDSPSCCHASTAHTWSPSRGRHSLSLFATVIGKMVVESGREVWPSTWPVPGVRGACSPGRGSPLPHGLDTWAWQSWALGSTVRLPTPWPRARLGQWPLGQAAGAQAHRPPSAPTVRPSHQDRSRGLPRSLKIYPQLASGPCAGSHHPAQAGGRPPGCRARRVPQPLPLPPDTWLPVTAARGHLSPFPPWAQRRAGLPRLLGPGRGPGGANTY